MKRIEYLRERWTAPVEQRSARSDHSARGVRKGGLFDALVAADPTPRKLYADFVLRTYAGEQFLFEDIDRIRATLSAFHAAKRRLPVEHRDIGAFESERALHDMLAAAGVTAGDDAGDPEDSGKAAKRTARDRAYRESMVAKTGGWTMARLDTAFSAAWWGMGTRWCTTERSGRTYKTYAKSGPLRVFVDPAGVKTQFHAATGSLCDATDRQLDLGVYFRDGHLPDEFMAAAREDVALAMSGEGLSVDPRQFSYTMQRLGRYPATLMSGSVLEVRRRIMESGLEKLCPVAEEDGWRLLTSVDAHSSWAVKAALRSVKIADSVYASGMGYSNAKETVMEMPGGKRVLVAPHARDGEVDWLALVPSMPSSVRVPFLNLAVAACSSSDFQAALAVERMFASVPVSDIPGGLWVAWVRKIAEVDLRAGRDGHGRSPVSFPAEVMTESVAMEFAKRSLTERIPHEFMTQRVIRRLVESDPKLLGDSETGGTLSLEDIAVVCAMNNGANLKWLPDSHKTVTMMRLATARHPGAFPAVLRLLESGSIDMEGGDPEAIRYELSMAAVERMSSSLPLVKMPVPRQVYRACVEKEPSLLSYVPVEFRDVEMCLAALQKGCDDALCHFPKWVVDAVREDPGIDSALVERYKPSNVYRLFLTNLERPAGEPPEKLPPFRVVSELPQKALAA